ncbi:MAG: hypothetical protein ACE5MM_02990 [Nitrospiraceae bacterium]
MRKVNLVLVAMILVGLSGCGESGGLGSLDLRKKANETNALAQLKKYSVAQTQLLVEEGRYVHKLSDLYGERGYHQLIDKQLLDAWHRSETPVPLSGYLFADIEEDENGEGLTDPFRCGLSAHPAAPGVSGDRVILILLDEKAAPMPSGPVGGGSWRLFWAKHDDVDIPMTRWPSEHELQTTFREIRKRTPREGLREAQEIMDDYQSGRGVKNPLLQGDQR